jgi:hypothetical protein
MTADEEQQEGQVLKARWGYSNNFQHLVLEDRKSSICGTAYCGNEAARLWRWSNEKTVRRKCKICMKYEKAILRSLRAA